MTSPASIKEVMAYFDLSVSDFSQQWKTLTDEDKTQLKAGIGDGSLTY